MKKKTMFIIAVPLIIILVLLTSISSIYHKGPWQGRVVDAETGAPIEGAAVVAVWTAEFNLNPAGGHTYLLSVEEAVTDKDGRFEFKPKSFVSIWLIRVVRNPDLTIFKPGYGSFPKNPVSPPPYTSGRFFENRDAVVRLPKFTSKEQRLVALNGAESVLDVPHSHIPYMINLINNENKYMGFETYKEVK